MVAAGRLIHDNHTSSSCHEERPPFTAPTSTHAEIRNSAIPNICAFRPGLEQLRHPSPTLAFTAVPRAVPIDGCTLQHICPHIEASASWLASHMVRTTGEPFFPGIVRSS